MATTKKTTSKSKVTDKKVVKKDGKVTVTYKTPYKSTLGTYPTSKVRKIYDDKGNLIKGNQRVQGSYGSYYDIGIKGKGSKSSVGSAAKSAADSVKGITGGLQKIKDTKKQETPTPRIAKAPVKKSPVSGKNVTSKKGAAKIKGIVEGLERPTAKKTPTKAKPIAPKMATTIGSAKVSVPSKGKVKIEPNSGKPKSFTPPKTETKPKVQTTPKPAPAKTPEPIKLETIPLATVAQQLSDSQRAKLPSTIEAPKSVATAPKTPAPAEEKKGLFARMKERREERRAERKAEKEAEKNSTAKMKKGGIMKKYKTGGMVNKMKKYEDGGQKKKATKKANSKSYYEGNSGKSPVYTSVSGPNNYSKTIEYAHPGDKKGYNLIVTKGGKTNKFQINEEQALNQRKIAKKEAGYKTGGMVNANAKLQAGKKAGSKGVMHSLSAKAIVQKIAKGRSGGTSAAPKTALPKAQYGFSTPPQPRRGNTELIEPANNPLANKPKKYLAYKDGIKPKTAPKKPVASTTRRVKKG
jgi:hypothetical protein